jgi:hypothetical protein
VRRPRRFTYGLPATRGRAVRSLTGLITQTDAGSNPAPATSPVDLRRHEAGRH